MRTTERKLLALTAAFGVCVLAACLLTFAGRGGVDEEQAYTYYFTNYPSADSLQLASVENASGSAILAAINGTYYAEGVENLPADRDAVQAFFGMMYRLPMKRLLDGADSTDHQFGLIDPQAEVLLQDTTQNGVLILVGSATPDGDGYYTCLSGDPRVFVMDFAYGQMLLSDVSGFFDMRLYPSVESDSGDALQALRVQREGLSAYEVSFTHTDNTMIASIDSPYQFTLDAVQARNAILTPLRQLKGVSAVSCGEDLSPYGLADDRNSFTLTYDGGTSVVIRVGRQEGNETYVLREDTGTVLRVPTANLSFFYASALQVAGQNLLTVSAGDLQTLQIGSHQFVLSGTPPQLTVLRDGEELPLEQFQNEVLTALNRISIQGEWNGAGQGSLLLTMRVQTRYGSADYTFYDLEGRQCGVAINGNPTFLCTGTAVQQLQSVT